MRTITIACLVALSSLSVAGAADAPPTHLIGIVTDPSGAAVPDADVRLEVNGSVLERTKTTSDGRFEVRTVIPGAGRLVVTAAGFAQAVEPVQPSGSATPTEIRIVLQLAPFFEAVNITSSRGDTPRPDATATVSVIGSRELLTTAAATIDDALKSIPGFSLFRRTSSRAANPTTQGLTMRGLSASGASRGLVLADGVPLNDAFGGWVYWDKIPHAAIDRIEIVRGGGSDLYGADAVGGIVQIFMARPGQASVRGVFEGGSLHTGRASVFGGARTRGWNLQVAGESATTDGFVIIARDQRGPIDTPAGSDHRSLFADIGYQGAGGWRFDGRTNVFAERRRNGTPQQINDTDSREGSIELVGTAGGLWSARAFHRSQDYSQTFSAVAADRRSEDLNRLQRVPSELTGISAQWIRSWKTHRLLVGTEAKGVHGSTQEVRLASGRVLGISDDGGRERFGALFAQATLHVTDRVTIVGATHGDVWRSETRDGRLVRDETTLNPRAAFSWRATGELAVRGSVFRAFRPPTLNELYRTFRVGSSVTQANDQLRPERLTGGEAGLLLTHGPASIRLTGFWNHLDDTITNVTLSVTPQLTTRRRQNAGSVRSYGVELEADARLHRRVTVAVAATATNARFADTVDPTLRGKRVPQVARYQLSTTARYTAWHSTVSAQLRVTGPQVEDDRNTLTLNRAAVVDLFAGRSLARGVTAFFAAENLFDAEYDTGRTPTRTVGLPRALRAGLQLALP